MNLMNKYGVSAEIEVAWLKLDAAGCKYGGLWGFFFVRKHCTTRALLILFAYSNPNMQYACGRK